MPRKGALGSTLRWNAGLVNVWARAGATQRSCPGEPALKGTCVGVLRRTPQRRAARCWPARATGRGTHGWRRTAEFERASQGVSGTRRSLPATASRASCKTHASTVRQPLLVAVGPSWLIRNPGAHSSCDDQNPPIDRQTDAERQSPTGVYVPLPDPTRHRIPDGDGGSALMAGMDPDNLPVGESGQARQVLNCPVACRIAARIRCTDHSRPP